MPAFCVSYSGESVKLLQVLHKLLFRPLELFIDKFGNEVYNLSLHVARVVLLSYALSELVNKVIGKQHLLNLQRSWSWSGRHMFVRSRLAIGAGHVALISNCLGFLNVLVWCACISHRKKDTLFRNLNILVFKNDFCVINKYGKLLASICFTRGSIRFWWTLICSDWSFAQEVRVIFQCCLTLLHL